jgi:hypothetical protein
MIRIYYDPIFGAQYFFDAAPSQLPNTRAQRRSMERMLKQQFKTI